MKRFLPTVLCCSGSSSADTFAGLGLIPRRFDFADCVDDRFSKDLPPSTSPARSHGKASSR